MAINRFDRPVNLDYNYTPYMPELFMPDFNAILKAGQVQDQITEESNKLASTKPNYIPTTQYTAYDEHGNPTTKTFGDTAGFEAYQGKQKEWQDRLTKAKLSGDANVFNSERDRIADEVKQSMLPDGQFYNLETRYKNYATQLQNMQKEKAMEDNGYKTAGNYGHDVMNFYNGIGEYKGDGKTSSNFGYNITPYTDIYEMLDKYADNIKSSGYNIERDTVNGRFIVRDKNGEEEVSPEKIKAVLDPFIQDPRVQQQLRVESYNKTTYTPEELAGRIESVKTQQEAYLNSIKDNTAELTKEAIGLGIPAKGKTDEQLYDLINKKLEEDRTSQLNQYSSLDANQRRALMLQENYQNKYVGSNITSHAWKKTDDIQQLRYDDLYMINYKANADLKVAKQIALWNQPKNGILATTSEPTPEKLNSVVKIQQNLYAQYDANKKQLEQMAGTADKLLSPEELSAKLGSPVSNESYQAYKSQYDETQASQHKASSLYNQIHANDEKYTNEIYADIPKKQQEEIEQYMKVNGVSKAQALNDLFNKYEKQQGSTSVNPTTGATVTSYVSNPYTKHLKKVDERRTKGFTDGELEVKTVGYTPIVGSKAEAYQKSIDKIYENPANKSALLTEAFKKGLIKWDEMPSGKGNDEFKTIVGNIPGTGIFTLNVSYVDKNGQTRAFVLDESQMKGDSQVFELFKDAAWDSVKDDSGVITWDNPNNLAVVQALTESNLNKFLYDGNLSNNNFKAVKQQYRDNPDLVANTSTSPIFTVKAGNTEIQVNYDPMSVTNPWEADTFIINTKENGKVTSEIYKGEFEDLKMQLGLGMQNRPYYKQNKNNPVLNTND